jgi:two-component sensor histidine kinase
MDLATPCGLLVNELLTNSLKHGFPAGRGGTIRVQLQPLPAPAPEHLATASAPWHLRVSDNGVGLPADFGTLNDQSLGLQLVADLVQQIRGRLLVEPAPGAGFSVFFTIQAQPPA